MSVRHGPSEGSPAITRSANREKNPANTDSIVGDVGDDAVHRFQVGVKRVEGPVMAEGTGRDPVVTVEVVDEPSQPVDGPRPFCHQVFAVVGEQADLTAGRVEPSAGRSASRNAARPSATSSRATLHTRSSGTAALCTITSDGSAVRPTGEDGSSAVSTNSVRLRPS